MSTELCDQSGYTHLPVKTIVRASGSTLKLPNELFRTAASNSVIPFVLSVVNVNTKAAIMLPFLWNLRLNKNIALLLKPKNQIRQERLVKE